MIIDVDAHLTVPKGTPFRFCITKSMIREARRQIKANVPDRGAVCFLMLVNGELKVLHQSTIKAIERFVMGCEKST